MLCPAAVEPGSRAAGAWPGARPGALLSSAFIPATNDSHQKTRCMSTVQSAALCSMLCTILCTAYHLASGCTLMHFRHMHGRSHLQRVAVSIWCTIAVWQSTLIGSKTHIRTRKHCLMSQHSLSPKVIKCTDKLCEHPAQSSCCSLTELLCLVKQSSSPNGSWQCSVTGMLGASTPKQVSHLAQCA